MVVVRDQTLISYAEERAREIHARCVTVERALRAMGFRAGSSHERIAVLVTKVAGGMTLRRTYREIAEDPDVDVSVRQVTRAIAELEELEVLEVSDEPSSPVQRRGRPEKVLLINLRMEYLREQLAEADAWASKHRTDVVPNPSPEYSASSRRDVGVIAAEPRRNDGETSAKHRHFENHTVLSSLVPNTHGPRPLGMTDRTGTDRTKDFFSGKGEQPKDPHPPKRRPLPQAGEVGTIEATIEGTTPTAMRLFRALDYDGNDGETLWRVAAAFDAGLISEHAIADAARASMLQAKRSRVGYFRTTLIERCETDAQGLRRLLARVSMRGGFPNALPGPPATIGVQMQSVPRAEAFDPQRRKLELMRDLVREVAR